MVDETLAFAIGRKQDPPTHLPFCKERSYVAASAILGSGRLPTRRYSSSTGAGTRGGDVIIRDCVYALCAWRDAQSTFLAVDPDWIAPDALLLQLAIMRPHRKDAIRSIINRMRNTVLATRGRFSNAVLEDSPQVISLLTRVEAGELLPAQLTAANGVTATAAAAARKRARFLKRFAAKGPVYEGYRMYSMGGKLLCHCDRRKVLWYLQQGLAEEWTPPEEGSAADNSAAAPEHEPGLTALSGKESPEQEEEARAPQAIRLTFRHKNEGLNHSDDGEGFYRQSRENVCVGCGAGEHYLRFHVLPACYKRAFPVALKSHRSHDVLLLCVDCHEAASAASERLKGDIAEELSVPLLKPDAAGEAAAAAAAQLGAARNAAAALLQHGERMPGERAAELRHVVESWVQREVARRGPGTVTRAALSEALFASVAKVGKGERKQDRKRHMAALDPVSAAVEGSSGHSWHGETVVRLTLEADGEAGLQALVRRFRREFVEAISPTHLPARWDVGHWAPREFGDHSIYQSIEA